jgi:hypothetical protein
LDLERAVENVARRFGGAALNAEILRCVSRRGRSEANAKEKASAHFAQDDSWVVGERVVAEIFRKTARMPGLPEALLVVAEVDVEVG